MIEWIHFSQTSFFIAIGIIGAVVGSFLNVVIHRLPIMLEEQWRKESHAFLFPKAPYTEDRQYNIALPAYHCSTCQNKIRMWGNLPIISFIFLKGRCSVCKTCIAYRYPAIECVAAIITLIIGWKFGITIETLAYCLLSWSLLALTMIDWDTQLLPDSITLPLIWGGLIFNSFHTGVDLYDAVWGAIAGYLSLWSVYWGYKLVTGKDGIGYGDFKLLAALGAWLGWMMLPIIIFLSSLVGTLVALALIILKRHKRSHPIPFGPYLAAAGFVALLWGNQLLHMYLHFMSV